MSEPVRRTRLFGWGGAVSSDADLVVAGTPADVAALFGRAHAEGRTVAMRGAGCAYGDAALNAGGYVLDCSALQAISSFDAANGLVTAEAGVTVRDLWQRGIPHGWWPPVVSGTAMPTVGGILAANIHGKNAFHAGTIANHVDAFTIVLPSGESRRVTRESDAELFHAVPGSFGLLGCVVDATIRLRKVPGGRLSVSVFAPRSLGEMADLFEREREGSDYLVGWIDGFARGESLGRGIVHKATYADGTADPAAAATLSLARQDLPSRVMGIVPKRWMWAFLRPFVNDVGMRAINRAKDIAGSREARRGARYLQSHAAFAFLLDYVPGWKRSYGRGGLIQYQSFVPAAEAVRAHGELIRLAQSAGLPPYLLVYKRHRPEPFLLTHAVDGFSLAMDFRVTAANRERLWALCRRFDEIVTGAGGRIYFAKDATATPAAVRAAWGDAEVERFRSLRRRLDPHGILRSDLGARLGLV
ncbi:MAG: FAD-binding oxidoreductase [Phycisphaerae bacterium]|nr:FAD-binding oxidoreductase [Phycisphaerae bacterium]